MRHVAPFNLRVTGFRAKTFALTMGDRDAR